MAPLSAWGQAPSASASAPAEKAWQSCVEYVPDGAVKPNIELHFPTRGLSGHELRAMIIVSHGRGETVLPAGFKLERGSDSMRAIEDAGFLVPDAAGGSKPIISRPQQKELDDESKKTVNTTISLPFVALPEKPGRHVLTLPPLPIAVGRANGQVMTLCTPSRTVTLEDPIANEADPKVRPNPPPRPQREEWVLAKQVTMGAAAVLLLAALGAYLLHRWSKRPRPAPPKPIVPPWIVAMRELDAIRASSLLDEGRLDEHVDRVNDCVRRYLGDRYGFDGIESTSEEIRGMVKRVYPPVTDLPAIVAFLDDTDLVKFAKATPDREQCEDFLRRAEMIVRNTIPPMARRAEEGQEAA